MRRTATAVAALGICGVFAWLLYPVPGLRGAVTAGHPVWIETKWPFLMDQWGEGKAFRCGAPDCGIEVELYIRPKVGFCSASTGIADDSELERLSDFHLVNGAVAALGDGHEINVAWMKGRLRTYAVTSLTRSRKALISIAYNNNSDALVATVVLNDMRPGSIEPAVIEFLNGDAMLKWVGLTLGLQGKS